MLTLNCGKDVNKRVTEYNNNKKKKIQNVYVGFPYGNVYDDAGRLKYLRNITLVINSAILIKSKSIAHKHEIEILEDFSKLQRSNATL